MRRKLLATTTHDLPAAYGVVPCEWQECAENAVCLRYTPWGSMPVCQGHAHAQIDDKDDVYDGSPM